MEKRLKAEAKNGSMNNKERFEHWMKVIIQHKDRASFEKMDKAMNSIPMY